MDMVHHRELHSTPQSKDTFCLTLDIGFVCMEWPSTTSSGVYGTIISGEKAHSELVFRSDLRDESQIHVGRISSLAAILDLK